MSVTNNIRQIRELYGATQEQVATAVNVNRVTVANWENGNSIASASNQEKLSMYFGIGPEFFYDKQLDDRAKQIIIDTGNKEREIVASSKGTRSKEDEYHQAFETMTFHSAMQRYMISMKILLAKADDGDLDSLMTAALINKKMGARLDAIVELRKAEEADGEPSIADLLKKIEDAN